MISERTKIVKTALEYASRGWGVFPVKPKSKAPATANGFKDAVSAPGDVEELFAGKDGYNLAVRTGEESGIWALDLDPGFDDDTEFVKLVRANGGLPPTLQQRTPRGGEHYLFNWNGTEIRSLTKINGEPIDTRGTGGYVLLAPSETSDGEYVILDEDALIADAPEWLTRYIISMPHGEKAITQPFDRYDGEQSSPKDTVTTSGLEFTFGSDSFAQVKGTKQGGRHDTAKSIIGSAFAEGKSQDQVLVEALAWAQTCDPPADEKEIRRLVEDIARKEGARVEADLDEVDAIELPEPEPWPEIGEDALHGIVGELVRTIEPETESDPVAILVQLLCSFGNMIGREPYFRVEGTSHHANLFAVLVGATARGRKGTSEGRVRQLLYEVDDKWTSERIANGLVSGEGLIWAVRDPVVKHEPVMEKKKIVGYEDKVVDPGIEDKRLMVVESEFASVLRACKREQNTLSPTLRSAWDSGRLRTLAKNSPAVSTGAHISIVGHITAEELRRILPETEGFSGFANRFLWLAVRRSKLLPDGGQDLDLDRYARRLADIAEHSRLLGRLRRDRKASDLWRAIYHDLAESTAGGLLGAVTSRAEAQVLRLSMIYALLDRTETISVEHLRAAHAVWQYAEASARRIFGDQTGDPIVERLLELIREEPGVSRRDLRRRVSSTLPKERFAQALKDLLKQDLAHCTREKTRGTKKSECWYPGAKRTRRTGDVDVGANATANPPSNGTNGTVTSMSESKTASNGTNGTVTNDTVTSESESKNTMMCLLCGSTDGCDCTSRYGSPRDVFGDDEEVRI